MVTAIDSSVNAFFNSSIGNAVDGAPAPGNDILMGGIDVLYQFMTLFNDLAQQKYEQMSAASARARQSQQVSNEVDAIIAQLKDADSTGDLSEDIIEYLRKNKIPITIQQDGKASNSTIDDYLASIGHPDGTGLNKGQLDVIKGALDADSGSCSDFVSQSQLQIQKVTQSYNVCVSLINSLQTMMADMMKSIAQNIH